MNTFRLLSISLLLCTSSLFSQTIDREKLDQYFQVLEDNNKFMGSVILTQNGEVLYQKTIGYCDVDRKILANKDSKYRIGSISKTFTTVLVFKAIEEGKLRLDQNIKKYFPKVKNAKKITIKYLLGHRSGIHNFTNDSSYLTYHTQVKTEKEMVAIIAKGGSDFEPGTKAEYSNSNFVLLSYILEKIYKKSYSEILKENIVVPLNLKNTYLDQKIEPKNNECKSYSNIGSWQVEPETDISIPLGAGAISSTPEDLCSFAAALFEGKLISKENVELMKTTKDDYGLGLFQFPFDEHSAYGHNGRIDGFSGIFSYFPDDKMCFALISNGTIINMNDIGLTVLSEAYDKPYEIPAFSTFEVTEEDLKQYVGVYASKEMSLKITISHKGAILIAQASGQPAFPLDAIEKDTFEFKTAGIVLEFSSKDKKMVLKQNGGTFSFTRED